MSIGYWIVKGDKTSCGGSVLTGDSTTKIGPTLCPVARMGDEVSCGVHPGKYHITGGHPGFITNTGGMEASTLYSRSSCPCNALFIPSQTWRKHGPYQQPASRAASSSAISQEPEQHAQAARKNANSAPGNTSNNDHKKKREITLTLGVFFDGTGNNAINTDNMIKACIAQRYALDDTDAGAILGKCARERMGVSGVGATSYMGYYTNVHWLNTLYRKNFSSGDSDIQKALYIDGIGTEAGKPDSMIGQGLGISDTGVIAKTDKAIRLLAKNISDSIGDIKSKSSGCELVIKSLQFDIFGFSRGAAASRHFANRIHSEDPAIIAAIRAGMQDTEFKGAPAGHIRFIGIFDTVAAIGTPLNGLNPHNADTGDVNLILRPGVAEKVFHITAANECRFNFALNSVKPAWPELALPGVHSDIGGGYLPSVEENLFLTRPETDTIPLRHPGEQTRGYHQATKQMTKLDSFPAIAPVMRTSVISVETWSDDRMPPDRYGEPQKRSYSAMTLRDRIIRNDWSKVALRVMYAAAQEAGVRFNPITSQDKELSIPEELLSLCDKAVAMGKSVRLGQPSGAFSQDETDTIARRYIHCSANWNAIVADTHGFIHGGASPSEIIGFLDRPDENWQRTVYNMDGKKV
ncbi:PAAR domain-containing protein [Mangrovibacter phragmitis]|uniref:PAAR domain-containing protein n=1 Tax=Mangrovibacter phragmitis TaxID=1691903 RepID=UPI003510EF50